MNSRSRASLAKPSIHAATSMHDRCDCLPFHSLHTTLPSNRLADGEDEQQYVPITETLYQNLCAHLNGYFPASAPVSMLLLHLLQKEQVHIMPEAHTAQKCRRYHAAPGILEQILVNVRRVIRANDLILVHEDIGALIILPDVDTQGALHILERIYNSVSLLQAETIIPPLKRETSLLMGLGTILEQTGTIEDVVSQASHKVRAFNLRPAITTQIWNAGVPMAEETRPAFAQHTHFLQEDSEAQSAEVKPIHPQVPFMELPAEIPARLKQLIPYPTALTIRCVPVGRNQHCLTVAMANPTSSNDIHQLREITGMTIFPVSCHVETLDTLLTQAW